MTISIFLAFKRGIRVQVPSVLPRIVEIPSREEGGRTFLLLEQMIKRHISKLFLNFKVVCAFPYRIMRNADLPIDEEEAEDLLKEIQKQLKKRQWGEVIRLEVEEGTDEKLLSILKKELHVKEEDIYEINGPIDLTFVMKLYDLAGCDDLRYKKYQPQRVPKIEPGEDIFAAIRAGDILMHHPYTVLPSNRYNFPSQGEHTCGCRLLPCGRQAQFYYVFLVPSGRI